MVEPFTLVLCLVLGILQARLDTQTCPLLGNHLTSKLFVFLFRCAQGLVGLGVEVGLDPSIILGVFDPLLNYKNFPDSLRKNNKRIRCKKNKYMYNEIIIIKQMEGAT